MLIDEGILLMITHGAIHLSHNGAVRHHEQDAFVNQLMEFFFDHIHTLETLTERALHCNTCHYWFSRLAGPVVCFAYDIRQGVQTGTELVLAPSKAYAPLNEGSDRITIAGAEVLRMTD